MASTPRNTIRYEPAIDGLRAIAVLAVLVFHIDPRWLPGGFVGVDIFFVISGYLITRILLGEFDTGSFSFGGFLYRRFARIVPALAFVGLATLLAATRLYSATFIGSSAANLVAALGSFANVKLWLQGNYFEASPLTQPFLHCWSLSLEEQFYLVFPVLLRVAWGYSRGAVLALLMTIFGMSLMACIFATPRIPTAAFYLLPFRAWELVAGSLLAVWVWSGRVAHRPRRAEFLRWIGTLGIGGAIIAIDESSGFPGWVALIPVLSTAALIGAMVLDADHGAWRWMVSRPIVGIGKVSYALYLTHWPVCAMVDYSMCRTDPWIRLGVKIVFICLFTLCLHLVVEVPARQRLLGRVTWKRELLLLVASLLVVFPVAGIMKARFFNQRRLNLADVDRGGVLIPANGGVHTVALIGDSHASQHTLAVADLCRRNDGRVRLMANWGRQIIPTPDVADPPLLEAALRWVDVDRAEVVIIGCDWVRWLWPDNRESTARTIAKIAEQTELVVVMTTQPCLPVDKMQEAIMRGRRPPYREAPDEAARRADIDRWLAGLAGPKVVVVDVGHCLVDQDGNLRLFDERGRYTFEDRRHVNEFGSRLVITTIEPAVIAAFGAAPEDPRAPVGSYQRDRSSPPNSDSEGGSRGFTDRFPEPVALLEE